jgi:hypothetical protein
MYSDNGKNFIGAESISRQDVREAQRLLGEEAARHLRLDWRFIPVYSPWFGGAWERLISYIKKCLNFTFAGEKPNEAVFRNAMIEAELIVNKRPLTHTPAEPEDEEPLTPNTALFGSSDAAQAVTFADDRDKYARLSRKRVAHLTRKFQRRWEKEYLPIIARADQSTPARSPVVDDVVLLAEGGEGRNNWKLARISRIHHSNDSVPRVVDLRMPDGTIKPNRAVGNLAVLNLESSSPPE